MEPDDQSESEIHYRKKKPRKHGAQNGMKLYPTDRSPFLCLGDVQSLASLCFADAPDICC